MLKRMQWFRRQLTAVVKQITYKIKYSYLLEKKNTIQSDPLSRTIQFLLR